MQDQQFSNPSRIVIVVGHPASGHLSVQAILNQQGVAEPQPGRQHGMAAADLSAYLVKRAGQSLDFTLPITQIKPAPLWQSLALDLLLANDQQSLWGWADPQSIYMLEYWYEVAPAFHFILVYDTPSNALVRAYAGKPLDAGTLHAFMESWQHYNNALLHFYSRHQDRCVLVHSAEVQNKPQAFAQLLHTRLQLPLKEGGAEFNVETQDTQMLLLAGMLIQPESLATGHENLQSLADMPCDEVDDFLPFDAWNVCVNVRQQLNKTQEQLRFLTQEISVREQAQLESAEENELLLKQLHKVQEALERKHLDHEALTETQKQVSAKAQDLEAKLAAQVALVAEREKKISALQSQSHGTQKTQDEKKYLLAQLQVVQEELERHHLQNQLPKPVQTGVPALPAGTTKPATSSPVLSQPVVHYGAAERVKQQLSYRLGNTLIQQSRSVVGLLALPSALIQQVKEFNEEKKAKAGQKLPPIDHYADAHEAEKVRQHLSYRLGSALLQNYRTPVGWMRLPFAMRKEIKDFKQLRGKRHH